MKRNQNPCQPLMRTLQKEKKIYQSVVYEFLKQTGLQLYRVNLTRQVCHVEHSGQSRPPGLDVIHSCGSALQRLQLAKKKK